MKKYTLFYPEDHCAPTSAPVCEEDSQDGLLVPELSEEASPAEEESFYTVQYGEFEGPIELLYNMIRRKQLSFDDVYLSEITNEFNAFVASLSDDVDIGKVMMFVKTAAALTKEKSDMLVGEWNREAQPDFGFEDDFSDDFDMYNSDNFSIIQRLKIYESFLQKSSFALRQRETTGRFYREPMFDKKSTRIRLEFDLNKLVKSFVGVCSKYSITIKKENPLHIQKDLYSVPKKLILIKSLLREEHTLSFASLFGKETCKTEIICVFLALLQLAKYQIIHAEQQSDNDIVFVADEKWLASDDGDSPNDDEFFG